MTESIRTELFCSGEMKDSSSSSWLLQLTILSTTLFLLGRGEGEMAESVVSSVLSQLASLVTQEAAFLRGVRDQVEGVKTELQRMEGFLKVAESRRRKGDERVEIWIREIRDVAYEVEDIIDTVKFTAERQRQRRGFMGSLSRYSHKPFELITLHKIGSAIEKIKGKIHGISESRATYGIPNLGESGVVEKSSAWDDHLQALRQFPDHYFDDTDVIGFKDDKEKLVKLLVDPENKNRSVISIVGMGGLGKTTLARKVYNTAEVKQHFDASVWLSISQNYDVKAMLKDIVKNNISSVTEKQLEKLTEGELKEKLYNFFQERRYFVVMDDIWEVVAWERLSQVFPNNNNGSRVLLTTRNIGVAKSIDPSIEPHELHFLEESESWELFRKKAFPNQDCPNELEGVGRNLAKKCGGLPLALVVLGAFMSSKERSYPIWSEVDKSIESEFVDKGKRCLDILALSFNDLSHLLKSCFLYIAAFPEDSIISASKLVRLWTAEGFIPQRPDQTLEKTARSCLDELVQRCMIQVVGRSVAHGWVKSIRIHDMLRDLGLSEARKDGLLHVCSSGDMAISGGITSHRAAFHHRINDEVVVSSPHLRTLLCFQLVLKDSSTAAGRFLNGLNLLRVLDLEDARHLKELPKEMGNMIHLRYLGLRNTGLKRLPSSIGHLLNLQTLDVRDTGILRLPKSFWKIRTLRHVYINAIIFITTPISGDHKNLQTLRVTRPHIELDKRELIYFIITFLGKRFIKNWVTTPGFTKKVKEIGMRGALERMVEELAKESLRKAVEKMDNLISFTFETGETEVLPEITQKTEVLPKIPWDDVLSKMRHLRSLNLEGEILLFKPQQVLDSSRQFLPNLTKLILIGSVSEQDPMPILEKLPNLRFLALWNTYSGKSMSCSAGAFTRLQRLILDHLQNLDEWRVEVGAMPSLTHFAISNCQNLEEWRVEVGTMPSLTHLVISNCRNLKEWRVEVGAMPSLTHLTINGCWNLKMLPEGLQHVTTLRELKLSDMPRQFNYRVRNEDEDGLKVRHISSIISDPEFPW